jgi:hypothetical protein
MADEPAGMSDLTRKILIEIRDEVRKTNERLDQTNLRLDQTNLRLDQTNLRLEQSGESLDQRLDRLDRRQTEAELRIATEIVAVAGAVRELKDVFLEDRRLAARVDDHERRLAMLESKG